MEPDQLLAGPRVAAPAVAAPIPAAPPAPVKPMSLDRLSILGRPVALPREEVPVPEWGGTVWVRTLTATERDQLEVEWERTKRAHFRARLAVATVCDADGKDLFQLADIPAVGAQPSTVLGRICDVAFRLNKFTNEDVEAAEKNSGSSLPAAS